MNDDDKRYSRDDTSMLQGTAYPDLDHGYITKALKILTLVMAISRALAW